MLYSSKGSTVGATEKLKCRQGERTSFAFTSVDPFMIRTRKRLRKCYLQNSNT